MGHTRKRYRSPKPKPGELIAQWGKLPHNNPDLCYFWGPGVHKADSHLLHNTLASKVCRTNFDRDKTQPLSLLNATTYDPSFLEELEARGYDVTTLRVYVRKKQPTIQLHDICGKCGDNRLQHASKYPYDHEFELKVPEYL